MKKLLLIILAIIFITGCGISNNKSINVSMESAETITPNEEVSEGINFKDKTLGQILPGFPEDIITLIDKQELSMISHLYYFPENDFINMTGENRDTCYKVEYIPVDAQKAFDQYMEMFKAKPGEDPEEFEVKTGNYLIRFRIHSAISTIYINCYTQLGEDYKEAKLDEAVNKYTPIKLLKNYLLKEVMVLPESISYIFEYNFEGDVEQVKEFYKGIIPDAKEETRNDVLYIEDSVIGTEIAQYITIDSKYKTVNVDEVTYQQ